MPPINILKAAIGTVTLVLLSQSCNSAQLEEAESLTSIADDTPQPVEQIVQAGKLPPSDGVFYVAGENPRRPLVRYIDGQISMSNSCGIKVENKLNRKIPPLYVNGQPIGFC